MYFTEEDIYIYHEMIRQDGEVDELVQHQCQTEWPTEGAENEEGKLGVVKSPNKCGKINSLNWEGGGNKSNKWGRINYPN